MKRSFSTIALVMLSGPIVYAQLFPAIAGVYRRAGGSEQGHAIWIVDGSLIRRDIYPEFLFGGNDQRYRFIPKGEIWIDDAVTADEYHYTVVHEIREDELMATRGMTYDEAHDSALAAEHALRESDRRLAKQHEGMLAKVSPTDRDGLKELVDLPDSIRLSGIYRVQVGKREGLDIWIVDGAAVRRDIFPDFGFSGNDLAYRFIPEMELWIDGQVTVNELEYSLQLELVERALMQKGFEYDSAYEQALTKVSEVRRRDASAAASRPPVVVPTPPDRDIGTGEEPGIR